MSVTFQFITNFIYSEERSLAATCGWRACCICTHAPHTPTPSQFIAKTFYTIHM